MVIEANPDGTRRHTIATSKANPLGIAANASHVYWAANGNVIEANLDGSGRHTVVAAQPGVAAIALSASHLYWTCDSKIVEANLDGTGRHTIITGQTAAMGIAVSASHVYWTNAPFNDRSAGTVVEANLNGSQSHTIATNQNAPVGIAVANGQLYWTNAEAGTVVVARLDGTHVHTIVNGQPTPVGVAVSASHLLDNLRSGHNRRSEPRRHESPHDRNRTAKPNRHCDLAIAARLLAASARSASENGAQRLVGPGLSHMVKANAMARSQPMVATSCDVGESRLSKDLASAPPLGGATSRRSGNVSDDATGWGWHGV